MILFRKHLFNMENITPLIFTSVIAILWYRLSPEENTMIRLSDTLFITALASFLLGLSCIVRNGGLLKYFAYISYRKYKNEMKRRKKNKAIPVDKKEDDYITFITNKYAVKWKVAPHFVFSGIYAVLFVLLLFISNR